MKNFEAKVLDLESMSKVRGGDWNVTLKESSIKYTRKNAQLQENVDVTVEIGVDVEIES